MTEVPRRKLRLRKWTVVVLVLALLYVLGWGPVAAWRDYHPPKTKARVLIYRLYAPVDFLHDHTPLHRPLHAWFTLCFDRMFPPA